MLLVMAFLRVQNYIAMKWIMSNTIVIGKFYKRELIQIKEGEKFLAENFPEIGKGIATPVTQKTFKYQIPIP